jgi:small conductance mechanosensitive channel
MEDGGTWQASWALLIEDLVRWTPKLLSGLVLFVLGLWLAGMAARGMRRFLRARGTDAELTVLLVRVTRISLASLATVLALQQVDFDLTSFVAGLGIMGFTVGFALQDVAKNLVAGMLLLVQQPFEIGEAIEVSGQAGVVTGINLRATELRTFDGLEVLIPNADVYAKVVRVFGHVLHRRQSLTVSAATGEVERLCTAVLWAVGGTPGIVADKPGPRMLVTTQKPEHTEVVVWFWVDVGTVDELDALGDAARRTRAALDDASLPLVSLVTGAPSADAVGGVNHVQARES